VKELRWKITCWRRGCPRSVAARTQLEAVRIAKAIGWRTSRKRDVCPTHRKGSGNAAAPTS